MRFPFSGLAGLVVAVCAICTAPAYGADPANPQHLGSVDRSKASRASELLEAAVAFLRHNGPEAAFSAFNDPKGSFIYGPYYVFVVDTHGAMLAHGGGQPGLVGTNTLDLRDAAGKPLIRDLIAAAAQNPKASIEYRWINPESKTVELKVSLFNKVDDYIVCVGYYTPRATRTEAQALLNRAAEYVKTAGPEKAFAAFNDRQGGFMHDDEYVFVIGIEDGRYRASGASPHLNGMDVRGMKDAAGNPLFEEMIAMAKKDGSGSVDYVWRNPATNAVESKHTLIQRVNDVLLGVGYYTR